VRYWLIGCSALLLIAGVLVFFGIRFIKSEFQDFVAEAEIVVDDLDGMEREFPFSRPEGGLFSGERYGDFVSCRRILKRDIDAYLDELAGEDLSIKEKVTLPFDMVLALGRSYAGALRSVMMSPREYGWFTDQTLLVLRYAEHPDAPEALKELRRGLDGISREDNPFRFGDNVRIGEASEKDSFQDLLPDADPLNVSVPAENIEAVVGQAAAIEETKELFFFDDGFHEALAAIKKEAEKSEREE
jgi:hypothetical protein